MPDTDVTAVRITGLGSAVGHRVRLKALKVATGGGAARFTLTDGDGGPVRLDVSLVANQGTSFEIPSSGILFRNGIFVSDVTNVTAGTLLYA